MHLTQCVLMWFMCDYNQSKRHRKTYVYLLTVTYLCVFPIYIYLLKLVLCVYFQALSPPQGNPLNLRHTDKFQLTADKNTLS